jgi:hypothetical protein
VELTWETKVALRSHPSCYRGSLDLNPGPGGTREASISVQETTAPRLWESWETSICDRNGWREVAPLHRDHKRGWGGEREREGRGSAHQSGRFTPQSDPMAVLQHRGGSERGRSLRSPEAKKKVKRGTVKRQRTEGAPLTAREQGG